MQRAITFSSVLVAFVGIVAIGVWQMRRHLPTPTELAAMLQVETVPRLQKLVRPQASYERSLRVLEIVKGLQPTMLTKSGLMLGLGETMDEVVQVLRDLRQVSCDIVTIGQYLRPTLRHLPVVRYVPPEEFAELERIGYQLGFRFVFAGPFVRSSYLADLALEGVSV